MENARIRVTVTINLNEGWASNLSRDELVEFVRERINTSLGFRGQIKRLSVVTKDGIAE